MSTLFNILYKLFLEPLLDELIDLIATLKISKICNCFLSSQAILGNRILKQLIENSLVLLGTVMHTCNL
jgi:hypothetical protein